MNSICHSSVKGAGMWRDGKPADIIVDPDGTVWVSTDPTAVFGAASYMEIEEIQSEDHYRPRRTYSGRDGSGFGTGRGCNCSRCVRGFPHFPESKYGIRDHRPVSAEEAEQARLYATTYTFEQGDKMHDILREWFVYREPTPPKPGRQPQDYRPKGTKQPPGLIWPDVV